MRIAMSKAQLLVGGSVVSKCALLKIVECERKITEFVHTYVCTSMERSVLSPSHSYVPNLKLRTWLALLFFPGFDFQTR